MRDNRRDRRPARSLPSDLVRIGLTRHGVGQPRHASLMLWRASSRKPRDGKIEAAPKELHRADLAEIPRAEIFEHTVDLDQRPPEAAYRFGIIGCVRPVPLEWYRRGHLVWHAADCGAQTKLICHRKEARIEVGDRHRFERDDAARSVAQGADQLVIHKIEIELDAKVVHGDQGRRQSTRGDIERRVPSMVDPRHASTIWSQRSSVVQVTFQDSYGISGQGSFIPAVSLASELDETVAHLGENSRRLRGRAPSWTEEVRFGSKTDKLYVT
jgi:hypothetical protein